MPQKGHGTFSNNWEAARGALASRAVEGGMNWTLLAGREGKKARQRGRHNRGRRPLRHDNAAGNALGSEPIESSLAEDNMSDATRPGRGPRPLTRRRLVAGAFGTVALPAAAALIGSRAEARAVLKPATAEDERFMRAALAEAAKADDPYYFGAVIVRDGKVLAKGRNLWKQQHDPTAHGEMVAIRRFLKSHGPEKLKGTTLYTSGESCPMCMGAIVWCGIARVVFGASIAQLAAKMGQILITDVEIADKTAFADIDITGGVLAAEAMALFK
jgi:tRNA(Arg) A34 adenosine deaminase TadA